MMVQSRGKPTEFFARSLRNITNAQVIFSTRKLESCLPPPKLKISNDLKSRVVFKFSCSICASTYVGQSVHHLSTRIEELKKADSPVSLHLQHCCLDGNSADLTW